jgi:cytochrome P450/NADPH-cytochrome P450 reductase
MIYTVISDRKKHPSDKKDLLDVMLNGRDKETGEGLSEENIAFNVRPDPSS